MDLQCTSTKDALSPSFQSNHRPDPNQTNSLALQIRTCPVLQHRNSNCQHWFQWWQLFWCPSSHPPNWQFPPSFWSYPQLSRLRWSKTRVDLPWIHSLLACDCWCTFWQPLKVSSKPAEHQFWCLWGASPQWGTSWKIWPSTPQICPHTTLWR